MRMLLPLFVVLLGAASAHQSDAGQSTASFQLVSIRKVAPISTTGFVAAFRPPVLTVLPGGRFEARRVSLEDLVRVAYGYERRDPRHGVIESKVSWAARDLFDITAAIDGDWTKPPAGERIPAELRLLLKGLVEERFALKARIETKRVDVFALRRLNREPANSGLRRSTDECVGPYTDTTSIEATGKPPCPVTIAMDRIEIGSVTMVQFADLLSTRASQLADRPIVDDTGLAGTYDVWLTTGIRQSLPSIQSASQAADATLREFTGFTLPNTRWASSVKQGLKEQLGLDMQKAKMAIPVLRIEAARKPSED